MKASRQRRWLVGALMLAVPATGLGLWTVRAPATTPVTRGRALAQELGCLGCHGPAGIGAGANPGSDLGEVPPLRAGGAFQYYVQGPGEIREWILHGAPDRLRVETADLPGPGAKAFAPGARGLIRMPSYQGRLTGAELDDLVAWVEHVAVARVPAPPLARAGYAVAVKQGCFNCHGEGGRGSLPNPGSFKGLIPPWDGDDYAELVRDEGELRAWITDGMIERFRSNPLAMYFLENQAIQMPGYGDVLTGDDLDTLVAYVQWVHQPDEGVQERPVEPVQEASVGLAQRGSWLYRRAGCVTCHGKAGRGGVTNPNAVGGFVPALDTLAETMELFEPEEVAAMVAWIVQGKGQAPAAGTSGVALDPALRKRYASVRDVILRGSRPTLRDTGAADPPMAMPSWAGRMHAEAGPLREQDVDAVIVYLLSLQSFDD